MSTVDVEKIYEQHIKRLSSEDRLRLLAFIARDLAATGAGKKSRSLLELEGLGAEIWEGVDAQEYVNELRKEWEHRS